MPDLWKLLSDLPGRPRTLFLIDGLGALLSLVLLLTVMTFYPSALGVPQDALVLFAIVAAALSLYSLSCSSLVRSNHRPFMTALAAANSTYCMMTLGALIHHRDQVTTFGYFFFCIELAIIAGLVSLEIAPPRERTART